jgi:hypothetical protein
LIPNIRDINVQINRDNLFLSLFDIRTRKSSEGGNLVVLKGGPNSRHNRYLRYQYDRMLWLIGAFDFINEKKNNISELK